MGDIMKTYHDLTRLPAEKRIIALGNFDGVHRGHQPIIEHAVKKARELEAEAAVFLFDPHPMERIFPQRQYHLLTTPLQRGAILKDLGIDSLILVDFTDEMMHMEPLTFVQEILINACGAIGLSVGYDYSFGFQGQGTVSLLQEFLQQKNLLLSVQPVVEYLGMPVSSTRIRQAINVGDIVLVNELLGREHQVSARFFLQPCGSYRVEVWPNLMIPKTGRFHVEWGSEKWGFHKGELISIDPGVFRLLCEQRVPQDRWLTLRFLSNTTLQKA
jgi:riboflavin kinase/FMN adenylyltransferase